MPSLPVDTNIVVIIGPLIDDTDFKTLEDSIAYNESGMSVDLFISTPTGITKTDITPTTGGDFDWTFKGNGMYELEIPSSTNTTEGDLSITGLADGVLPFTSPVYQIVPVIVYDAIVAGTDTLEVDAIAISGDTTAADNLELQYDGTGLTGGSFPASQAQVSGTTSGSAGISTVADSGTVATGTPTNTYTSTQALDSTYWQIDPVAGALQATMTFNVGTTGIPSSITIDGRVTDPNPVTPDIIDVEAYDYVAASWSGIGIITGTSVTTDSVHPFTLTNTQVDAVTNPGEVSIRFTNQASWTASTSLYIDRALCNYAVVASPVGYAGGAIWVDTLNGTAGAVANVNGVADNPVDNWADAILIANQTSLVRFEIAQGSTITFTTTISGYAISGLDYNVFTNAQQLDNVTIRGAAIDGIYTGNGGSILFISCKLLSLSMVETSCIDCILTADITLTDIGTYFFKDCASGVAGTSAPTFDMGVAVANTAVNFRNYSGGIHILNMGQSGTDTMSLEGYGQFILAASCIGGAIAVRGSFSKHDNSGGLVTVIEDANFTTSIITSGFAQGSGSGNNQIQLAATASSTDGAYDPSMVIIINGTGKGQSRNVLEYDGDTRMAIVDRNWKTNPDATSEYRIMADAGREHINEGLAQGGTVNTITLNTLASASDDAYVNQLVLIRSGTGDDQAGIVDSYDGTTKIATMRSNWTTTPDTTSAYEMLPQGYFAESADSFSILPFGSTLTGAFFTTFGANINNVSIPQNASGTPTWTIVDADDVAVDLSGKTIRFVIHDYAGNGIHALTTTAGDITITGANNNQVNVTISTTETADVVQYRYKLWNMTDDNLLASGDYIVKEAPKD